jgi:hypothetical protein
MLNQTFFAPFELIVRVTIQIAFGQNFVIDNDKMVRPHKITTSGTIGNEQGATIAEDRIRRFPPPFKYIHGSKSGHVIRILKIDSHIWQM